MGTILAAGQHEEQFTAPTVAAKKDGRAEIDAHAAEWLKENGNEVIRKVVGAVSKPATRGKDVRSAGKCCSYKVAAGCFLKRWREISGQNSINSAPIAPSAVTVMAPYSVCSTPRSAAG
jgi:hypothetical protein